MDEIGGQNYRPNLYSLDNQFGKDLGCSCQGNRIISLAKLGDYIHQITKHAADCGSIITFLGEWKRIGLSSVLLSKCTKCHEDTTGGTVLYGRKERYSINVGAVMGQISSGRGSSHLQEQLACIDVPSIHHTTFISIERELGVMFEDEVMAEAMEAGKEEKMLAEQRNEYHEGVQAISVVVGWSKRSHKHSYNANSDVGVIFGAVTKRLLFIGVRNKYCSVCSIASRKNEEPQPHMCFKNWSGSSCAMEADIISEGFRL